MLVNDALHWVVTPRFDSEDVKLIASFNLGTEEYQLVPQPEYSEKNFHMNVQDPGGSLCVLCNYLSYIDIWVMNDSGVKDSWIKLISLAQPNDIRSFEHLRPIAYSKSGDQVLLEQEGGKLLWYDLKLKPVKNISIPGMAEFSEAYVCVGSLVKLTGGRTNVTQEKREKENSEEER